jgi:hypothetical protein
MTKQKLLQNLTPAKTTQDHQRGGAADRKILQLEAS